jgi:hypothetical protein
MAHQKGRKTKHFKRSAVGGQDDSFGNAEMKDDPYGNVEMNTFLSEYNRITFTDACKLGVVDLGRVTVWIKRATKWEQHQAADLLKGQNSRQSICRALVTRLYGWTHAQYESLRDAFDDTSSKDVMGIYANGQGDYAIVGRLPVSDRFVRGAIGLGGLATGMATGMGGMWFKNHQSSTDVSKLQEDEVTGLHLKLLYDLLPKWSHFWNVNPQANEFAGKILLLQTYFQTWNISRKGREKDKDIYDQYLEQVISAMNYMFDGAQKRIDALNRAMQRPFDTQGLQRMYFTFAASRDSKKYQNLKSQMDAINSTYRLLNEIPKNIKT